MELGDDQNDAVSSPPSTVTLTSLSISDSSTGDIHHAPPPQPQHPIFPVEIVEEIIIRFPVKFLSQLRCVCKSWNALISDPKFARRHLRRLNRRILLVHLRNRSHENHFVSYPLTSVLKPVTTGGTQIDSPLDYLIIGSCDGIICCFKFSHKSGYSFVVWNPSIRKFWELPPLENLLLEDCDADAHTFPSYGFGYDHLSDSFKVIVIFYYVCLAETHVMVHTLGSNSWRRIQDSPCIPYWGCCHNGKFVSGAVNWLTGDGEDGFNRGHGIISLDLGKESYQEFLQPDYGIEVDYLTMGVMRDCLCLLANSDVWVMKEYGNNDSWTKLFSLPSDFWHACCPYILGCNSLCVLEDDETIFFQYRNLDIYNYKSGTFRSSALEYKPGLIEGMYFGI
ncbi:F-box/kelch-repeat protein At3g23880-like [Lotus japonicus]|uniref:F-box/kelch-repeat protein At3g23880-like n=1 Tax=Lotus japonicus TaxID=34305 RepID=UPI002586C561|nr:F-box/kelch-repeat protein At3g23880-like [Lotus japonicus]